MDSIERIHRRRKTTTRTKESDRGHQITTLISPVVEIVGESQVLDRSVCGEVFGWMAAGETVCLFVPPDDRHGWSAMVVLAGGRRKNRKSRVGEKQKTK